MSVPETLQSQSLLEKLMQTRVRNLMAQPAAALRRQRQQRPRQPLRRKENNRC